MSEGLGEAEKLVLYHLASAYNTFMELGNKHPDDDPEFRHAIHALQSMIATRVARRIDKNIWGQY